MNHRLAVSACQFVIPQEVPDEFALAIWAIGHGQHNDNVWSFLRQYEWEQIELWAVACFDANGWCLDSEQRESQLVWLRRRCQNYQMS